MAMGELKKSKIQLTMNSLFAPEIAMKETVIQQVKKLENRFKRLENQLNGIKGKFVGTIQKLVNTLKKKGISEVNKINNFIHFKENFIALNKELYKNIFRVNKTINIVNSMACESNIIANHRENFSRVILDEECIEMKIGSNENMIKPLKSIKKMHSVYPRLIV